MANEQDIDKLAAATKGLQSNLQKAQEMADIFAAKAAEATGKSAQQLQGLSKIYESIAKNTSQVLETQTNLQELDKKRKKILEEIEKLKKSDATMDKAQLALKEKALESLNEEVKLKGKSLDQSQKQITAQKDYLKEIQSSTSSIGKMFDSSITKAAAYLFTTERLISGLKAMGKSVQDVVDISVTSGSFLGMSGNFDKDFATLGKAAVAYGTNLTKVAFEMGKLGISTEEGSAAFKEFSQITSMKDGLAKQADQMKDLTVATGYLSKALNVSLGDATDYVVESQLKFGRSGAQSAQVMQSIRDQTEKMNSGMATTIVRGRDVTKVLFDITRESQSGAQDQELMAKMITKNLVALQSQGANYEQALKGASTYVKKLTTEAPDWTRILAGRDLFQTIKKATDSNGGIGGALSAQLEKAKPGLTAQVQAIMKDTSKSQYTKERLVQGLLQDTSVGLSAMEKQLNKLISQGGEQAAQVIQSVYGISDPILQNQMIDQAKMGQQAEERAEKFKTLTAQQLKDQYGLTEDAADYYKDEANHAKLKEMIEKSITEEHKKQLGISNDQIEAKKKDRIDALQAAIAEAEKKGQTAKANLLRGDLSDLQGNGEKLKAAAKAEEKKRAAANFMTGGDFQGVMQALQSGVGKIVTGIASLGLILLANYKQYSELRHIREILAKTNGDTFGGSGGTGTGLWKAFKGAGGAKRVVQAIKGGGLRGGLKASSRLLKGTLSGLKGGMSGLKGISHAVGKLAGPISGLVDFGLNVASGEGVGRSALKAVGSGVGGVLGGIGGTALLPGVGTAAGGMAGSYAGDWLGGKLADMFGLTEPGAAGEKAPGDEGAEKMAGVAGSNNEIENTPVSSVPQYAQAGGAAGGGGASQAGGGSVPTLSGMATSNSQGDVLLHTTINLTPALNNRDAMKNRYGAGAPFGS